jgi:hypothetical protein
LWHIALKNWYLEHKKTKANFLLWHEAIQLEALSVSKTIGKPSAFLTADKGFIAAVSKIINERYLDQTVLHFIVMPIQFSYYIDLDEERNIDWKAYSKILWSKAFQERHIKYSEYYIDKILQEYEPKLIDSLPRIVNAINAEIEKAPSIDEISYQDEEARFKEFKYIEDFDEKFYRIMNEEKDKLGLV